jgi:hypothetical protein
MLGADTRGIATIAILIVAIATASGVSTPVVVDQIDTLPDSPLYGLERIGESVAEVFVGGMGFDIERGNERTDELVAMAERGRAEEYLWLVDEAEDRFAAAIEKAGGSAEGLETASEAVLKHLEVLENVLEKVPDVAKAAISAAIVRSSKGIEVISDVKAGVLPVGEVREQLRGIEREAETIEEEIRANLDNLNAALRNVERRLVDDFLSKLERAKPEDFDDYEDLVSVVQDRIESIIEKVESAADTEGLAIAEEMVQKHLDVLLKVYENVPEQAKAAISIALERSAKCVGVLAKVRSGELPVGQVAERLEEFRREAKALLEEARENLKRGASHAETYLTVLSEVVPDISEELQDIATQVSDNRLANAIAQTMRELQEVASQLRDSESAVELAKTVSLTAKGVLEGLLDKVPEEAVSAIEEAIQWCQTNITMMNQYLRQMGQVIEELLGGETAGTGENAGTAEYQTGYENYQGTTSPVSF